MSNKKKKVYLMLSGGVDSSVAALLLKRRGFDVVGVYFKKFKADGDKTVCKADAMSAKKVAEKLGIEFKIWDFQDEYEEKIFKYFINSYASCKTPNPDIVCNREIKFSLFVKKALKEGADFVASGHYAKLVVEIKILFFKFYLPKSLADYVEIPYKKVFIKEAKDKSKDQSYFLSQVDPDILPKIIFPLANLTKAQARILAGRFNLHTAGRKESQGLCFVGKELDIKSLLSQNIDLKKGLAFNLKGEPVAEHSGAQLYTVGERRGFKLLPEMQKPDSKALYLIDKDCDKNLLILGSKEEFEKENSKVRSVVIKNLNIFSNPQKGKVYCMRIRHRGKKTKIKILRLGKRGAELHLCEPVFAPSVGQFAAIYSRGKILLSGEIDEVLK